MNRSELIQDLFEALSSQVEPDQRPNLLDWLHTRTDAQLLEDWSVVHL